MFSSTLSAILPRWKQRFDRIKQLFDRYPWLVPLGSFTAGWISFFAARRGAEVARLIAALAVVGWLWLLAEPFVRRAMAGRINSQFTPFIINYITQSIQQELLFFALPFIFGALQMDVGQIVFTGLVCIAALISTIDPLFERHIAATTAGGLGFHAFCTWIMALVALPIVVHVPVEQALPIACVFTALWTLVTLPRVWSELPTRRHKTLWVTAIITAPLLGWLLREHVPAAGLAVTNACISRSIDKLVPGPALDSIASGDLGDGVVAFVAIRAPMGLSQSVVFQWRHGRDSESIRAQILGGNKQGWRTYSRKKSFPAGSQGDWTVDVLTPQGQLLKRLQFTVI